MKKIKTVVYPGTFDPITKGHLDVIETCGKLFDKVIVVIANNKNKKPMFTIEERIKMVSDAIALDVSYFHSDRFAVEKHDGLIVDFGMEIDAIIRGVRSPSEFDKELNMAFTNDKLSLTIGGSTKPTILIPSKQEHIHISSSAVRELLSFGDKIRVLDYLCPSTAEYINHKKDN